MKNRIETKTNIKICFLCTLLVMLPLHLRMEKNGGIIPNAVIAVNCAAAVWENNPAVFTQYGDVKGFEDNDTWAWKAIPYASAPKGDLRWQAPRDPEPWQGIRQETEFGSMCVQFGSSLEQDRTDNAFIGDEDCLYLNIWRPRSAEKNLPIYFWIHGGSNIVGSADPYPGAVLADRANMVVVTINYRLGPLGWFTHPALREGENELNRSGNYATLDTIKALEWVRDNIEAFGGDPENVTIAGESAGGINVLTLVISPAAAGLFHRAISQSGGLRPESQNKGDAYANTVIESLLIREGTSRDQAQSVREGMSNDEIKTFLRSRTTEEFLAAVSGLKRSPYTFNDGTVIHRDGTDALDDPRKYNRVPVIIGTTSEESKVFMYLFGLHERWGSALYQRFAKTSTRVTRAAGTDTLAQRMRAHGSQPGVYSYVFIYGQYRPFGYNAWPTDSGPTDKMSWAVAIGAAHAVDIPFNFGIMESFSLFGLEEYLFREDNRQGWQALSDAMISYTAQFARSGNPNTEGLPEWTEWPESKGAPKFILFDANDQEARIEMSAVVP